MKKQFFALVLCFVIGLCCFGLVGCGERNYTKDDVDTLYTSIKNGSQTSQFFDGNNLKVEFDTTKINMTETDKSYIFVEVYDYYLISASRLVSSIIDRVGRLSYIVKNFSSEQTNQIYSKLKHLNSALNGLAKSKTIYETSEGNLQYKNLISAYNNVLNKLYDFNLTFAEYYFSGIGGADFSTVALSDSNAKDMLLYQLLIISKISFNYELKNFIAKNPLGEINTWYNSTIYLKEYVEISKRVINKIKNIEDMALHIGSNSANVQTLFANMQSHEKSFHCEEQEFMCALDNFDIKSYLASTNKEAYLGNCTDAERSYFKIISNFLEGRYEAYLEGLSTTLTYIV